MKKVKGAKMKNHPRFENESCRLEKKGGPRRSDNTSGPYKNKDKGQGQI